MSMHIWLWIVWKNKYGMVYKFIMFYDDATPLLEWSAHMDV